VLIFLKEDFMKDILLSLKIAAVFIGTVVGAGLASGQEIIQFFTIYGPMGIPGIFICGVLYAVLGIVTIDLSYKYNAASYRDLIYISCGKYLGFIIDSLTTFFLFGGTCIILAGSGSIFSEYFGVFNFIGILVMIIATMVTVFYSTEGLIFINSIIVPSMISIVVILFIFTFSKTSVIDIKNIILNSQIIKNNWVTSTLLYTSFNMLTATGVLAPMTRDIKDSKAMSFGIILGSIGLLLLTLMINLILLKNSPDIFKYSIPMLHVAKGAASIIGTILSITIWCEMFSTEVSDVYSISKKMNSNFNINYKLSIVIILAIACPFTGVGFAKLIKILYPPFGVISLIYIIFLLRLYFKS
jgi:uncharacterized membrane protein YkvI